MKKLSDEELDKMTEGQRLDYYLEQIEIHKQQNTEHAEKLDEAIESGLVDRVKKVLARFFDEGWPGMVWDSMVMIAKAILGLPV